MRAYSRTSVSPRRPPCRTFASERLVRTVLRLVRSMVRTISFVLLAPACDDVKANGNSLRFPPRLRVVCVVVESSFWSRFETTKNKKTISNTTTQKIPNSNVANTFRSRWAVGARGESPRPSAFASYSFPFLSFPSFVVVVVVVAKHTARSLKVVVPKQRHKIHIAFLCASLVDDFWVVLSRASNSRELFFPSSGKKVDAPPPRVVVVVKERSLSLGSSQTQRYNKTHTTTVIMVVTKMPDGSSFSRPLEFRVFLKNLKP